MLSLQANPSLSQSNANRHADKEPSTEQDQICPCMSLLIASQNTKYYLQAGCGQACAGVASAKMAHFAEALSLWFDHVEALSLRFDHVQVLSFRSDLAKLPPLQFVHLEAISLGFDLS
jgi:hypothetical protein